MALLIEKETSTTHPRERDRAVKIIARSLFRELRQNGYDARQIVALATEVIALVTAELKPPEEPGKP